PRRDESQDRGDSENPARAGQRQSHHHRRPGLYRPPRRYCRPGHCNRDIEIKMKLPRASTIVASVFGIGYFDVAPGTIMSAIAVSLAILIAIFGGGGMGVLSSSLIAFVLGVLACADHVRETTRE